MNIRAFAKRLPFATSAARTVRRAVQALPRSVRPAILMYHRIATESFDPWGLTVGPDKFADQLKWLTVNRTVLTLSDFAARHRDRSLPRTAVAITFDDGYACFAETAAPILNRLGVPATMFLPVELIERGKPFWWDELENIVLGFKGRSLRLGRDAVHLGDRQTGDAEWKPGSPPRTPRQTAFERLWALLRPLPPAQLDEAMASLREQAGSPISTVDLKRLMNPDEVQRTSSDGIDFGSHALTHPWLASLDSVGKQREICDSSNRIAALTDSRPAAFAYPYGNFDGESEELVMNAGFACACTTEARAVTRKSRPFALPRIGVGDWDAMRLSQVLERAY